MIQVHLIHCYITYSSCAIVYCAFSHPSETSQRARLNFLCIYFYSEV